MNIKNCLNVLEDVIEEKKELRNISCDDLFLQFNNGRYHLSIETSEFCFENNIKIID